MPSEVPQFDISRHKRILPIKNIHGLVSVPHSEFFAFNLRIKRSSKLKLSKEFINTNIIMQDIASHK